MISIKEIFDQGRNYSFPRPPNCLRCDSTRIWGHGYVEVYFDGYNTAIELKRYRCDDCNRVYTIRPFGYWSRHHVSITVIVQRLWYKVEHGIWDKDTITRQRQLHWLKALKKNRLVHLGISYGGDFWKGICDLIHLEKIPIQRLV
jgi:hypothetical protein